MHCYFLYLQENNVIEADCENFDWDTEDELEISDLPSSRPTFAPPDVGAITCNEAVLNPGDTTITCKLAVLNPTSGNSSDNGEVMSKVYGETFNVYKSLRMKWFKKLILKFFFYFFGKFALFLPVLRTLLQLLNFPYSKYYPFCLYKGLLSWFFQL